MAAELVPQDQGEGDSTPEEDQARGDHQQQGEEHSQAGHHVAGDGQRWEAEEDDGGRSTQQDDACSKMFLR